MSMPLNSPADASDPLAQARYNMIEQQIRPWSVLDPGVLALLARVRREDFVPPAYRAMAFMDLEIPLPSASGDDAEAALRLGQCMLAPRVEARMLQDLRVAPGESVLEIGAGSGYMAALLAQSAERVLTLEIVPALAQLARDNLARAGIVNAEVRQADGASAALAEAPFDVIVLSGSVAELPGALLAQLREGGRLGAIVGSEPVMRFTIARRSGERFATSAPWDGIAPRLRNFPEPSGFDF